MFEGILALFRPSSYPKTAKCVECGKVGEKRQMIHDSPYGWFCNREELISYWRGMQT